MGRSSKWLLEEQSRRVTSAGAGRRELFPDQRPGEVI